MGLFYEALARVAEALEAQAKEVVHTKKMSMTAVAVLKKRSVLATRIKEEALEVGLMKKTLADKIEHASRGYRETAARAAAQADLSRLRMELRQLEKLKELAVEIEIKMLKEIGEITLGEKKALSDVLQKIADAKSDLQRQMKKAAGKVRKTQKALDRKVAKETKAGKAVIAKAEKASRKAMEQLVKEQKVTYPGLEKENLPPLEIDLSGLYLDVAEASLLLHMVSHESNLRMLDLSRNNLRSLPDGITRQTTLEVLNLSDNLLKDLPEAVGGLPGLKELDISKNRYSNVPVMLYNLPSLEVVNLEHNRFTSFAQVERFSGAVATKLGDNPWGCEPGNFLKSETDLPPSVRERSDLSGSSAGNERDDLSHLAFTRVTSLRRESDDYTLRKLSKKTVFPQGRGLLKSQRNSRP